MTPLPTHAQFHLYVGKLYVTVEAVQIVQRLAVGSVYASLLADVPQAPFILVVRIPLEVVPPEVVLPDDTVPVVGVVVPLDTRTSLFDTSQCFTTL